MTETTFLKVLHDLVVTFGPVGALGFLMSVVIGYFYRRDFLLERARSKALHERAEQRENRVISIVENNAIANTHLSGTIEKLANSIERSEENRQRHLETLTNVLSQRKG